MSGPSSASAGACSSLNTSFQPNASSSSSSSSPLPSFSSPSPSSSASPAPSSSSSKGLISSATNVFFCMIEPKFCFTPILLSSASSPTNPSAASTALPLPLPLPFPCPCAAAIRAFFASARLSSSERSGGGTKNGMRPRTQSLSTIFATASRSGSPPLSRRPFMRASASRNASGAQPVLRCSPSAAASPSPLASSPLAPGSGTPYVRAR